MIVKVCGITRAADATAAVAAGANAIGFNFYPRSPRYIAPEQAALILTPHARRVGVFVNEPPERVAEIARLASLDTVQLHGDENPADYPAQFAIWKAIRVAADFDLNTLNADSAEAFLLDGPAGALYGGAGIAFDWNRARPARLRIIIAGGLDGDNVARAIEASRPWGVDACSRIESSPGIKDHVKMQAFVQAALAAAPEALAL